MLPVWVGTRSVEVTCETSSGGQGGMSLTRAILGQGSRPGSTGSFWWVLYEPSNSGTR